MKISYNWLSQYIDIDKTPEELSEILTDTGLEVEGLEKIGPRAVEFLVTQGLFFGAHDVAQVEPDSYDLLEFDANRGKASLHLLEGVFRTVVDGDRRCCGGNLSAVDPGDVVVVGDDDAFARPLDAVGRALAKGGVGANTVTLAGLGVGLLAAVAIGFGLFKSAFALIVLNRIIDGLDGQ